MVLIWCVKIGWFTGFGYMLGFSFIKRWTILGITNASMNNEDEDVSTMQTKIVIALAVVHLVQFVTIIFVLR